MTCMARSILRVNFVVHKDVTEENAFWSDLSNPYVLNSLMTSLVKCVL